MPDDSLFLEAATSNLPLLDVARFGQVFTPRQIVARMLALRRNAGRVLEPSCGDGAFSSQIPGCVALELDPAVCPSHAQAMDFFAYPEAEKFDTIIGNPPYIKARDILPITRRRLGSPLLNGHANLYFYFIEKCIRHLKPSGELIFITPRDFLKTTGSAALNTWLYEQGTITHFDDLGDARIFDGASPNCAIWRFEKGNFTHRTSDGRHMALAGGQLMFTHGSYDIPLRNIFSIRVGAVSGADDIFTNAELGNADFVCSKTAATGELRRMIFDVQHPMLEAHKDRLLARRVTNFNESNWWKWGRQHFVSDAPRIYVNHKTRYATPFFINDCKNYDGAVLGLFPHDKSLGKPALQHLTTMLNNVDWAELGFVCDGRYQFAQRSLEQAMLPEVFGSYTTQG
jgi:adenine-specific DNA-methyltransferase